MGNSSGITPLNSPGGSTLQWGAERGLVCVAALVIVCYSVFQYKKGYANVNRYFRLWNKMTFMLFVIELQLMNGNFVATGRSLSYSVLV